MTIEKEIFIIETDNEIFYWDSVIEFLSNKIGDMFNFFNITKYKKQCEKYIEYKEWMIGDTF